MANLDNGKLEVRTLGDLKKFVSHFDGLPDETELNFEDQSSMYKIVITNEIDISFSTPSALIECKVVWDVGGIK